MKKKKKKKKLFRASCPGYTLAQVGLILFSSHMPKDMFSEVATSVTTKEISPFCVDMPKDMFSEVTTSVTTKEISFVVTEVATSENMSLGI